MRKPRQNPLKRSTLQPELTTDFKIYIANKPPKASNTTEKPCTTFSLDSWVSSQTRLVRPKNNDKSMLKLYAKRLPLSDFFLKVNLLTPPLSRKLASRLVPSRFDDTCVLKLYVSRFAFRLPLLLSQAGPKAEHRYTRRILTTRGIFSQFRKGFLCLSPANGYCCSSLISPLTSRTPLHATDINDERDF